MRHLLPKSCHMVPFNVSMVDVVDLTTLDNLESQVNTLVKLSRTQLLTHWHWQGYNQDILAPWHAVCSLYCLVTWRGSQFSAAIPRAVVKDVSNSLLVFIISAVRILDTRIPIPVSHLTWVLQHNVVLTLVGHLDIPGHCESGLREGLPAVDTDPCDPMPHQVQDTGITAGSQCDDDLRWKQCDKAEIMTER